MIAFSCSMKACSISKKLAPSPEFGVDLFEVLLEAFEGLLFPVGG